MARIWLVTGPPGVGKSTVVSRVVLDLKSAGVIVGGCTTVEKRSGGTRVGFGLRDLTSGRTGELASITGKVGPRVGRYRVNLSDLADIAAAGIEGAVRASELIVVDEVGPMELTSPEFRRAILNAMASDKPILAVVHERMEDDVLNALRSKAKEIFALTIENREAAAEDLRRALLDAVGGSKLS